MVYHFVFETKALLKKNSRTGSKKNISFHYDLGNSFYEKWLDESMTYSSAMFKDPGDNLHKGQINKYENLANITGVEECDKILEVGCGWEVFPLFSKKILSKRNSNYNFKKTV